MEVFLTAVWLVGGKLHVPGGERWVHWRRGAGEHRLWLAQCTDLPIHD